MKLLLHQRLPLHGIVGICTDNGILQVHELRQHFHTQNNATKHVK